jgi:hypothetical protein
MRVKAFHDDKVVLAVCFVIDTLKDDNGMNASKNLFRKMSRKENKLKFRKKR